jgi:uncharacterized protein
MRAILDTSVIVSGLITPSGTASEIIERWLEGQFTLLYSQAILEELEDVLQRAWLVERLGHMPDRIGVFLTAVAGLGELVTGYTNVQGHVRDPFDEMFLACARLGAAAAIVTLDKDLLAAGKFEETLIMRPQEFLDFLDQQA